MPYLFFKIYFEIKSSFIKNKENQISDWHYSTKTSRKFEENTLYLKKVGKLIV